MKKMNNQIKFLAMVFSIAMASVLISCGGDDDPIIIDEDPVVADGFYILGSATSETPDADLELGAGTVGSGEAREGFYAAYIYLSAGSFNYVLYSNNEPTVMGGSVEELPLANNADYSYLRGTLAEDGAAVSISEAGLYHVHADLSSSLFFVTKVDYFEIIGSCTPDGWGSGQELAMKSGASADGVTFEGTNITLRTPGEYKFRYNSNWDTNIEDVEGLNIHSNFGLDGIAGGTNFAFDGTDGVYTITVTYAPGSGESLTWNLTRTGDAEEITYNPADYPWGIIGAATSTGWDADTDLTYLDWAGTWTGVFYLGADAFKFRTNESWTNELNPGNVTLDASSSITTSGGDFINGTAGLFYVRISTPDEGVSWNLYVKEVSPGIIGAAVANGWDGPDNDVPFVSEADGTITWKIEGFAFGADEFKVRLNDGWENGFGYPQFSSITGASAGVLSAANANGDANLKVSTAGNYTVTITTSDNGATFALIFD